MRLLGLQVQKPYALAFIRSLGLRAPSPHEFMRALGLQAKRPHEFRESSLDTPYAFMGFWASEPRNPMDS